MSLQYNLRHRVVLIEQSLLILNYKVYLALFIRVTLQEKEMSKLRPKNKITQKALRNFKTQKIYK